MIHRGYAGNMIEMCGSIDMHVHPYPDIFPRLADDVEIAIAARDMGFSAMVYKCHHENTVSRAYLTSAVVPGIEIFGAVVLNSFVGGINPAAVDVALAMGGRVVWMPTIDVHEGSRDLVGLKSAVRGRGQIRITDERGHLTPEVNEVIDIVAARQAVLATAHLSPGEVKLLVREASLRGIERIVLTHPFYRAPGMSEDDIAELVSMGAKAEFGYCDYSTMWHVGVIDEVVAAVRRLGAENCLLVSDCGQMHNPMPSESLRIFAQTVYEQGIPANDVYTMIRDVPAHLLGLGDESAANDTRVTANWSQPRNGLGSAPVNFALRCEGQL